MRVALVLLFLISCTKKEASEPTAPLTSEALVNKGRAMYQTHCTSCHNPDPRKSGPLGPDLIGSSRELIERKVIHGDYPPDYKAKRVSKVMVPLPHLKNEIEAISAYLNAL